MKNYYKILQIDTSAEKDIIEAAYRKMIKKYHPDILPQKSDASTKDDEKARDIIEAYEVLSNDEKRRDYDIAYKNFMLEKMNRQKEVVSDEKLQQKVLLVKCSNTKKTYKMNLVRRENSKDPYIVKSFDYIDEEQSLLQNSPSGSMVGRINAIGNNIKSIVIRETKDENEIHIGDIEWTGVRCPDCGKYVHIRPGLNSAFGTCPKCHRLKCTGDAIQSVAGYYTTCPWCGERFLLRNFVKTGSKGGAGIKSAYKEENDGVPRLPGRKLIDGKK